MTALPWQRPSPDRRTVLLPHSVPLAETLAVAEATGWRVLAAVRCAEGVRLLVAR